ncbi:TolC family protein [Acidobacteria bacterium AH-259-O06]|nr:TolC family protein [Acidobacteria bacterium AH-259-O06]
MSTVAIGTLIRFRNTILHLEKTLAVVAGPVLRRQLEESLIGRVFDIQENLYCLIGSEIEFVERKKVRGTERHAGWWARVGEFCKRVLFGSAAGRPLRAVVLLLFGSIGVAQGQRVDPFPSLAELERTLAEAPDLRAIQVELERQKLEDSWGNQVFVYGNYSQYFPSVAPLFPLEDFGLAGGTTVGISVSVPLDRLLRKKTPADLDRQLKALEYETLFQHKLASLRTLYRERLKFLSQLNYLKKQKRTVDLQLEKVHIGLSLMPANLANQANGGNLMPFVFDRIDLAQAEERVAGLETEIRQAELDIESIEAEILGLLGKGQVQP